MSIIYLKYYLTTSVSFIIFVFLIRWFSVYVMKKKLMSLGKVDIILVFVNGLLWFLYALHMLGSLAEYIMNCIERFVCGLFYN